MVDDKTVLRSFTLALATQKGMGPVTYKNIVNQAGGIEKLHQRYVKSGENFLANFGFKCTNFKLFEGHTQNFVCSWEETFPQNLLAIHDCPILLFYNGNFGVSSTKFLISVVGSRMMSNYGKKVCEEFVGELAASGFTIASGLAHGIDSIAHNAALEAGGKTIAVIPGAVGRTPSPSREYLYERIVEHGGLILSEDFPETILTSGMFISRNRIIAGLALGTIVIEAKEKSGALSTATFAFHYDRNVYAIPGDIYTLTSQGCNNLIKDLKAKLVTSSADILIDYGLVKQTRDANFEQILTSEELRVYNALLTEAKYVEDIASELSYQISNMVAVCSVLEIKGAIIKNEQGKYFALR